MRLHRLEIEGFACGVERTVLQDLLITLSEQHGRICEAIGKCGDMDQANLLAEELHHVSLTYEKVRSLEEKAGQAEDLEP